MQSPIFIDQAFIEANTNFADLVYGLQMGFSNNDMLTPERHHHDFPNKQSGADTTMLLMPAWQDGADAGVKVVTLSPNNFKLNLPSIQGTYLYLDAESGVVKAILDAKSLTNKRTAAASALASSFLSNPSSKTLLMIGTGALSPELIRAHSAVRPIEKVLIWGRNSSKAEQVKEILSKESYAIEVVEDLESAIPKADIISAATLSETPLIHGAYLKAGQHIDLVGSFKSHMREADDEVLRQAKVFADVKSMAIQESGDLKIPLEQGVISMDHILGDLFDLCQTKDFFERKPSDITLFKSVGYALEDLIAARYYYKIWTDVKGIP
jgi:ornithine cyclodeaminase/alanine dehydrogenase-like protein (mu-crystallin family)